MKESQCIEWKQFWRDEYLKWICGFANADGGVLVLGKDDKIPYTSREGQETPVETSVEMPVETREKTREITREKILRLISENPGISMEDMATVIGITRKGVEWQIRKLSGEGILQRVGPDKGGYWEVKT